VNYQARAVIFHPGTSPSRRQKIEKLLTPDPNTGQVDYAAVEREIPNNIAFLNKKTGIPGFWDAVLSDKVGVSSTPVIDEIVSDKEFYIYMDKIVEYYSGKKPILKGLEAKSFRKFNRSGREILDQRTFDDVFKDFDSYVVKAVDGRGG